MLPGPRALRGMDYWTISVHMPGSSSSRCFDQNKIPKRSSPYLILMAVGFGYAESSRLRQMVCKKIEEIIHKLNSI